LLGKETLQESARGPAALAHGDVVPPVLGFGLIDTLPRGTRFSVRHPPKAADEDSLKDSSELAGAVRRKRYGTGTKGDDSVAGPQQMGAPARRDWNGDRIER
jgi:hypothetical protein